MASKLTTLLSVVTGYFSNTQLNANFTAIADEFDKVVYRDGTSPNAMSADLDINSNDILNASRTYTDQLYIAGVRATSTAATPSWQGAWVTATAYALDDVVSDSGNSYICVEAHTSGTFATDLAAVKWEILAAKGATGAGTGDMLGSLNLSDLASASTSRTNLGVAIGTDVLGALADDTSPQLGAALDTNSKAVYWSKGADVASATELLVLTDGNSFDVTGTTTITSIEETADAFGIGSIIQLQFDGALTLTHHATDLILPGAANITTAAGDVALLQKYASGDWRCCSYSKADGTPVVSEYADLLYHIQDQKSTGGNAQWLSSSTWNVRQLNTELTAEIPGASLSSRQITLPVGTYWFDGWASAGENSAHQAAIYNVTDSSYAVNGSSEYCDPTGNVRGRSSFSGRVTIAGTKVFELRHYCTRSAGSGVDVDTGQVEIYADVKIWKVA